MTLRILCALLCVLSLTACGGGGTGNQPQPVAPVAGLTASATAGRAPLAVSFTSISTDIDGSLVTFRWDFDGNGTVDRTTSTGSTDFIYTGAGTFDATLTVVDDDGLTDSATATISVAAAGFVQTLIDTAGTSAAAGPAVTLVEGNPAVAYFSTATGRSEFRRATDAKGTAWGAPVTIDVDGGEVLALDVFAGVPCVLYRRNLGGVDELIVRCAPDAQGTVFDQIARIERDQFAEASSAVLLNVAGNPAVFFIGDEAGQPTYFYERALDAAGTDWSGTPRAIASIAAGATLDAAIIAGNPAILVALNGQLFFMRAADAQGADWTTPSVIISQDYANPSSAVHLLEVAGRPMTAGTADDGTGGQVRVFRADDALGATWGEIAEVPEFNDPFVDDFAFSGGRPLLVMDDTDSDATHLIFADNESGTAFGTLLDVAPDGRSTFVDLNGSPAIATEREDGSGLFFVSQP